MIEVKKIYNLEDRTANFGVSIISFCKKIQPDLVSRSIIDQLVRSSTSIGANYMEANGGSSRKDFRNKIYIARKEAQETMHWLRMLLACVPDHKDTILVLRKEAHELVLIFGKIASSLKQ